MKSVKIAWQNCRLRAHGHTPKREKNGKLSAESRARLAAINLHFHDLRREAGSRFREGGMPANYVQEFLDHAALSTTSRYLKINRTGMQVAMKRFEEERNVVHPLYKAPIPPQTLLIEPSSSPPLKPSNSVICRMS